MAAGNPISGKSGTIKKGAPPAALVHIKNWKITESVQTDRFADNSSSGWARSVPGRKEWEGSFEGVVNDGEAIPVKRGDSVDAQFHLDSSDGQYKSGKIVVSSVEIEVDIDTGKTISYTASFEGDGQLTDTGSLIT